MPAPHTSPQTQELKIESWRAWSTVAPWELQELCGLTRSDPSVHSSGCEFCNRPYRNFNKRAIVPFLSPLSWGPDCSPGGSSDSRWVTDLQTRTSNLACWESERLWTRALFFFFFYIFYCIRETDRTECYVWCQPLSVPVRVKGEESCMNSSCWLHGFIGRRGGEVPLLREKNKNQE